jgi:flagellar hook assembly protein FlgD
MPLSAGSQTYTWNGQGNNGVTWPDGNYTLSITATGATGQAVTVSTQVQGTISSVNVSQNPPLVTVGGQSYPISAIQSINSGSIGNSISNSANSISNSISNSINTANNSSLAQLLH